jgi:DNA-binding response OmpR family regulator
MPKRPRVRRLARLRAYGSPHQVYERGRLRIDFDAYEVLVDGRRVHLSLREFELLRLLAESPNRVFDREQILRQVWGKGPGINLRTIDVHVHGLRTRLERNHARPELIVTVRGAGYKFDDRAFLTGADDSPPSGDDRKGGGSVVATTASIANPAPSRAAKTSSIRRTPK